MGDALKVVGVIFICRFFEIIFFVFAKISKSKENKILLLRFHQIFGNKKHDLISKDNSLPYFSCKFR